ncbi:DUF5927 domain-containing protein [Citreimonas sp.]|uniref:DUF5927 domain-containing protein n=1 Tax=Citreimonas sp. TaxID=3036715 RepID=UPI004058EF18
MSMGVIMLVHTALDRAAQVARHWAKAGCPVVIHVDRQVPDDRFDAFRADLSDLPDIAFSSRHRCEWGTWGLVAATLDAATMMLGRHDVRHVYLASGACLPLRPVPDLLDHLASRPDTDFIESATTADVPWTVGGLDRERFTLYFPVSWRRNKPLFDALVAGQRALGIRRRPPRGVVPHMGSQWWCLTARTLRAILDSPDRRDHDAYFRRSWIPDESYFQSLARVYATEIEARSLTLSKFDFQGKPHIFYDDHLQLLRRSDCFVARKIWPRADRLYDAFLGDAPANADRQDPQPGKIDRVFATAVDRRLRGRAGLYMQSRFPRHGFENGATAGRYAVFHGFDALHDGFRPWLAKATGACIHGHLYAPDRAHFAGGEAVAPGALTDDARLRDYNPKAFLTNLLWNMRGVTHCFLYGPEDMPDILWHMARDPNARISVVSGAWAVPLWRAGAPFEAVRARAAALQRAEASMIETLRAPEAKARVRIQTMAQYLEAPEETLEAVAAEIGWRDTADRPKPPALVDLHDFGAFLQRLRNAGMDPYLTGDFPLLPAAAPRQAQPRRYVAS